MGNTIHRWGVEIEAYGLERQHVAKIVESATDDVCVVRDDYGTSSALDWSVAHDGSIKRDLEFELRTPALYGEVEAWAKLRAVCAALRDAGAQVGVTCGLHVHHDASYIMKAARMLGRPEFAAGEWLYSATMLLYARMEKVLDTLMPASRRDNNNIYCASVFSIVPAARRSQQSTLDGLRYLRTTDDHHAKVSAWTSFLRHNTIEYRQHSGTLNASKIIAWVKLTGLIHHKIADIICYNHLLPNTIGTLEELMDYLDAEPSLRRYFAKRQATLATQDKVHRLSACRCDACKHNKRWVVRLLDFWAYCIAVQVGSTTWHPFTKETTEAVLGIWTPSMVALCNARPLTCGDVSAILAQASQCIVPIALATKERSYVPPCPSRASYMEGELSDVEPLVAGDNDANFCSHGVPPYVAATKAGHCVPKQPTPLVPKLQGDPTGGATYTITDRERHTIRINPWAELIRAEMVDALGRVEREER